MQIPNHVLEDGYTIYMYCILHSEGFSITVQGMRTLFLALIYEFCNNDILG